MGGVRVHHDRQLLDPWRRKAGACARRAGAGAERLARDTDAQRSQGLERLPTSLPLQLLLCETELRSHAVARLRAGMHALLRGDEEEGPAPTTALLAARVELLRAGGARGVPGGA